jgi:predicted nucleic acid-binding protein
VGAIYSTVRSVYVETTVISYLTAKPSRDLIVAAHQQVTREWWEKAQGRFDLYISAVVLDEVTQGNPDAAERRRSIVADMKLLEMLAAVEDLKAEYSEKLPIPDKALADCYHLALASWHGMDYLVSWNMKHIVNGDVILTVQELNAARGIRTPLICTPEELVEDPWSTTP